MQTFYTPAPISATVDIVLGDVHFIAGDRDETVVEVHPVDPSRELDVEAAEKVDVDFSGGVLTVEHPKLRTMFAKKFGAVRVRVELPTGSDVRAGTAQGELLSQGRVGACRLKTAIGDIRVGRASTAGLRTSGGRVVLDHATDRTDVTGNGDVRIRRVDGDAAVKSLGGDIAVGEIGTGTVDLNAVVGAVEVGVPEGTAVRLDAKSSTGRVRNGLETVGAPEPADRTVSVRARCNGGDITVHRSARHTEQHGTPVRNRV
ncbi:DUF4097 family beta strand repeat-containing protein [Salininema proteolyticum]|uniref:DUF4097 family beta strand repeat-containing protein n=1 Tax=Salininema proteolyticum TaxID=1607685 RepID=A0ABV8U306_9ACTN